MDGRLDGERAVGVGRVSFVLLLPVFDLYPGIHNQEYLINECMIAAFVFDSDPLQSKICHCEDCQRLHGESALTIVLGGSAAD